MTCARIGLPPISCRTLGCFDLSRVPLPAAMIATATRGRGGLKKEGFDLVFVFGGFAMLSQYTANPAIAEPLKGHLICEESVSLKRYPDTNQDYQLRIVCRSCVRAISAIRSCASRSVACRATSPSSR